MSGATLTERYRAARRDGSLVVLEGLHALKHALRFGADVLDVRTADLSRLRALAEDLAPDIATAVAGLARPVDPPRFDSLAPSAHPTGVIGLARRPRLDRDRLLTGEAASPLVLLERPTHHGNIGAAVRVAAAAGAAGVLVTGPHDPWHPASVRGGAGLQFALPVASLEPAGVVPVIGSDRPVVVLDPGGAPLSSAGGAVPPRAVLAFGSERTGVSARLLERADRRVSIPMREGVSSLNLATSVAIALYLTAGELR